MTAMFFGTPAIAATAFAGTPLAMKAMPGPLPMPMSTLSAVSACCNFASPAAAEKIRSAVPGLNLNYLSIFSAEARGFFKDENLENETIVIGGPAGIAALVSGDVDFSGAGGSGLRAAVKGAPLKAILYQTERPTWYLVVHPSVTRVGDLKGDHFSTRGLDPRRK